MSTTLESAYEYGPLKGSIARALPAADCGGNFVCPYLARLELVSESLGLIVQVDDHSNLATPNTRYFCMHPRQRQQPRDPHNDCEDKTYQISTPKDKVSEPIYSIEADKTWHITNTKRNRSNPNA